jgi:type IV pilus assembly protein PilY1
MVLAFGMIAFAQDDPECLDISDAPLITQSEAVPPNIMFVLDDSTSMDYEVMTSESGGTFNQYRYIFDDLGDNKIPTDVPFAVLSGDDRGLWRSQWHGYNRLYYNPAVTYEPWTRVTEVYTGISDPNADPNNPPSHINSPGVTADLSAVYHQIADTAMNTIADDQDASTVFSTGWTQYEAVPVESAVGGRFSMTNLTGAYVLWESDLPSDGQWEVRVWIAPFSVNDGNAQYTIQHTGAGSPAVVYVDQAAADIPANGGWVALGTFSFDAGLAPRVEVRRSPQSTGSFTFADAVEFRREGEVIQIPVAHYFQYSALENLSYLVTVDNGSISYFRFEDLNDDDQLAYGEIEAVATPPADVQSQRDYAAERQNFANWFTYYRRRSLTATDAMARALEALSGVRVGAYSINGQIQQALVPIDVDDEDQTLDLLEELYEFSRLIIDEMSPLRIGLQAVGQYYDHSGSGFAESPVEEACQHNFAVVFTDGFWNGDDPGVGNADGDQGAPFADNYSDTLADVAMHYYETDLATGLDDLVPPSGLDRAEWQHMVIYAVALGVEGTLDRDSFSPWSNPPSDIPWPDVHNDPDERVKIDDLWHATINSRGVFYTANDPEALADAFTEALTDIQARIASAASVAVGQGGDVSDSATIYLPTFSTDGWSGDIRAYSFNTDSGEINTSSYLWSAAEQLDNLDWQNRYIATYQDEDGDGVVFEDLADLTADQQAFINNDQDLLDYLRGRRDQELQNGGERRDRIRVMGDIVQGGPVFHDGLLYAGGNDGMLHAFNADTGIERFAYVPGLVFDHLAELGNPDYDHRFYVDKAPYIQEISSGNTLLVGGLGKGGKGYYALNVSGAATVTNLQEVVDMVAWEFPAADATDSDMGYSYSPGYVVNTTAGWVVIFSNGYNSVNGRAVLFVLNTAGTLITKIDTGVGGCNGLSSPALVDVDNDDLVDYAYAGDLRGNLWKFDLTAESTGDWTVSYSAPLFAARDALGNPQPITTEPDVMKHCLGSLPGYIVAVGTGKYLGQSDIGDTSGQTIYGVWDYGDDDDNSEFLGAREEGTGLSNQSATVSLLQQSLEIPDDSYTVDGQSLTLRFITRHTAQWVVQADGDQQPNPSSAEDNNAGWLFDLPIAGERIINDPIIRDGKLLFTSSIPTTETCRAGGDAIFHEVDACSGRRLRDPQLDITGNRIVDAQDEVEITYTDPDTGGSVTERVPPSGLGFEQLLSNPGFVRGTRGPGQGERLEYKVFSTSAGGVEVVGELSADGIYYWMQHGDE